MSVVMREAQPEISISNVHGTLSSLKLYQNELRTAMDIVTDVAMDVAESQGENTPAATLLLILLMLTS